MPYGDPDVPPLVRSRPSLLTRAQSLSARRMEARSAGGRAAVAPPDGLFDPALLGGVDVDDPVPPRRPAAAPPARRTPGCPPASRWCSATNARRSGGPAPTGAGRPARAAPADPRPRPPSTSTQRRPIVVRFPMRWDPGAHWRQADFFGGLCPEVAPPRRRSARAARRRTTASSSTAGPSARPRSVPSTSPPPARCVRTGDVLGDLLANAERRARPAHRRGDAGLGLQRPAHPRLAADQVRALDDNVRGPDEPRAGHRHRLRHPLRRLRAR